MKAFLLYCKRIETVGNCCSLWSEQGSSDCGVAHSECVMRAERLWEAAHTGLGWSPPARVCRLTDSSALVYHTAAWLLLGGGSAELAEAHPSCRPSSSKCTLDVENGKKKIIFHHFSTF